MVIIQGKGIELLKALIKLHQDNKLELSGEVMTRLNGRLVELLQPELFLNETVGHELIINVIVGEKRIIRGYFVGVEEDTPGMFVVYIRKVDKDECYVVRYQDILAFFYES